MTPKEQARAIWQAGVDAVSGYGATAAALATMDAPDRILAVGKAATEMARAALDRFPQVPTLIVTKDGHANGAPVRAQVMEAAHPVPDHRSLAAGRALREAVEEMHSDSRLLLLVSGGASSLAEDLRDGHDLSDLAALNQRLLADGLDITAMNVERRKISRIKGGGLLSGFRGEEAEVLAISDVPGDDLAVIGSGIGSAPDGARFRHVARIVASNAIARDAAAEAAQGMGYDVVANLENLHAPLEEAAKRAGLKIGSMARGVVILGGEPTVVLPDTPGRGGRNQALALSLAKQIAGRDDIVCVVGGTDGSDGPTEDAGGVVDGQTWGDGAAEALARADSGSFLKQRGDLLTTGPTGTNVMDLTVILKT